MEFALTKTSFYVITACAIAFSFALQSYILITFSIATTDYQIPQSDNQTTIYTYYFYEYTNFTTTQAYKVINLTVALFRDLVLAIALIVLNMLILVEIKQVTQRRIFLTSDGLTTSISTTSESVRVSLHAERRKLLMIIATGVNYFLGHLVMIIYSICLVNDLQVPELDQWYCFVFFAPMFLWISYTTPFFFTIFLTFISELLLMITSNFSSLFSSFLRDE
jgi:hypothetical protein